MKPRIVLMIVRGRAKEESAAVVAEALGAAGHIVKTEVVHNDLKSIRDKLAAVADDVDVVFTLGGTGLSPKDVTPEATKCAIDREAPGLMTALMLNSLSKSSAAAYSRAIAGLRGGTLIINLPGGPKAIRESVEFLREMLPQAVEMIQGPR